MPVNTSRYRKIAPVVTIDHRGRQLRSFSIRLLPHVTGRFRHTVEDVDRLDHLSFKYYDNSKIWWNICDANPETVSPLQLPANPPIRESLFRLARNVGDETWGWPELLRHLSTVIGIVDVQIQHEAELLKEDAGFDAEIETQLRIFYNSTAIDESKIAEEIEKHPVTLESAVLVQRIGKQIVIPQKQII